MSTYVMSFRSQKNQTPTDEEEAAWGQWFQSIGESIADYGNRVGASRTLGASGRSDELSGYVLVRANGLDEAEHLASGCPGLSHGGSVEVGEVIEM
jgi:hypothetical protein